MKYLTAGHHRQHKKQMQICGWILVRVILSVFQRKQPYKSFPSSHLTIFFKGNVCSGKITVVVTTQILGTFHGDQLSSIICSLSCKFET